MSSVLHVAEQLKAAILDHVSRLNSSYSDEDLALKSELLSFYREVVFTVNTIQLALDGRTPHPLPSTSSIEENHLRALSFLRENSPVTTVPAMRLALTADNKQLCHQLWGLSWKFPGDLSHVKPYPLYPFALSPFQVQEEHVARVQLHDAIPEIFSQEVTQGMKNLVQTVLRSSSEGKEETSDPRFLQDRLLLSLWCDSISTLRKWASELQRTHHKNQLQDIDISLQQLRASIDQFDQGLRDLLLRKRTERFSIAIIGVEGSGKSSLLNYMIGHELLYADIGQATAYPCRIQHRAGRTTPELDIDVTYLNERLALIRDCSLFKTLKEANWNPNILFSESHENSEEGQRMQRIIDRVDVTLKMVATKEFRLEGPFIGYETITNTLRTINHIVQICRALGVPFEQFTESRWATISLEFRSLKGSSEPYELLDLPGLYGHENHVYWRDLVQEALRDATALIVVISAQDVRSRRTAADAWRNLPDIISDRTSLIPSAVVLTQSDRLPLEELGDRDARDAAIRKVFWSGVPNPSRYPIFECSIRDGRRARTLLDAIDSPSGFDIALSWDTEARAVLARILRARDLESAKRAFGSTTLPELRDEAMFMADDSQAEDTSKGIFNLVGKTASVGAAREGQGIISRIHRILTLLWKVLHALKVLTTEQMRAIGARVEVEQEREHLLYEWIDRKRLLMVDWDQISVNAQRALIEGVEYCIVEATTKIKESQRGDLESKAKSIYFVDKEAVDGFISALQAQLMDLQQETANTAEDRIQEAKTRQLQPVIEKAGALDATVEAPLSSLFSNRDMKSVASKPQVPGHLRDDFVTTRRVSPRRKTGYKDVEERILSWLSLRDHALDQLSPLARILLRIAAFVPYLFMFPLLPRRSTTVYCLDRDGFLAALKSVVTTSWEDGASQVLQKRLQDEAQRGTDLIERAIEFAASQSEYTISDIEEAASSVLEEQAVNIITAGYLNLLGGLVGQEIVVRALMK
ncbi:hypothetical protein FRC14_002864 [Serendipita sp. 396]|nr:hypothetical protein FRC14_002864 [Serendipita sp. 396]KAG8784223.1 hypothetical protein FRC15_003686 [Serendipita sp. 397]KAG8868839.1 hypothetical protein FRC20_002701 [Serendipita sp. 405]